MGSSAQVLELQGRDLVAPVLENPPCSSGLGLSPWLGTEIPQLESPALWSPGQMARGLVRAVLGQAAPGLGWLPRRPQDRSGGPGVQCVSASMRGPLCHADLLGPSVTAALPPQPEASRSLPEAGKAMSRAWRVALGGLLLRWTSVTAGEAGRRCRGPGRGVRFRCLLLPP